MVRRVCRHNMVCKSDVGDGATHPPAPPKTVPHFTRSAPEMSLGSSAAAVGQPGMANLCKPHMVPVLSHRDSPDP